MRSYLLPDPRSQIVVGMCEYPRQQRNRCRCRLPTSVKPPSPAGWDSTEKAMARRARPEFPFVDSTPRLSSTHRMHRRVKGRRVERNPMGSVGWIWEGGRTGRISPVPRWMRQTLQ